MTALWLWCGVCLLAGIGLAILAYGQYRHKEGTLQSYLQQSIERHTGTATDNDAASGLQFFSTQAPASTDPKWLHAIKDTLNWRTWGLDLRKICALVVLGVGLFALAWLQSDAVLGVVVIFVYVLIVAFVIWLRLSRKRRRMLEQLPVFLDNMVRLLTVGNSPQAAFQMATAGVQQPLGQALQQASSTLAATANLGQAMELLHRSWKLPEFGLLAAVFRMSTQYGGRADQVLERVAAYIRDRLSAERELRAMSSEVRLSAWVLSLLPLVVGALIMFLNAGYFMHLWRDPSGRQMLAIAAGLEVIGVLLLYRLARLR
ncbi:MAG: type II secretion system F family protein [Comamonas sp.]|nr:type II secretion system F family protein [Candidatus Comamonas equi]